MYRYIRPLLFLLNPELAHHLSMKGLKLACFFGLIRRKNITSKPLVVIAKTTKGKGVSFMENKVEWHYKSPNDEEYIQALNEINNEK